MINKSKFNRSVNYGIYAVYAIVALIGLAINFWTLNKCLVTSDDSWYLCLMRDLPTGLSSSAHLLLFNVFNDNIYAIRLACYLLNIAAGGVFAWGLSLYADRWLIPKENRNGKNKTVIWVLMWLFVVFAGQLRVVTCPSFNYITLNQIVMQFSLGLLMISLVKRNSIAMFFSGFFIAMLVPVMITNVIAVPFIFVFVAINIYIDREYNGKV